MVGEKFMEAQLDLDRVIAEELKSLGEDVGKVFQKISKLEEKAITKEQEKVLTQAQLSLQCYDKGQITEEELGPIMGICFKTGKPIKDWDKLCLHQTLMQLSDKTLVTGDVVRKCLFNLPPKIEE